MLLFKLRTVSTLLGILFLASYCSSTTTAPPLEAGVFNKEPIASDTVLTLHANSSFLMVGTTDGIYKKDISDSENELIKTGLDQEEVVGIAIINEEELIAGIKASDFTSGDTTLFKSVDQGETWMPQMGNYGGESGYTWVGALETNPQNPNHIFARGGANVSYSSDKGQSWESIFLTWEHFGSSSSLLKIDPNNPDIIWGGGANTISYPSLFKSKDGGENWQVLNENLQIFENTAFEATAYSLVVRPGESDHVLLGLSGGIFRSTDGGITWQLAYNGISARTLVNSVHETGIVYASGVNQQGTVFFARSRDFGESWEITEFEDGPAGVTVNDMVAVEVNGKEVLYLGTDHGLYSYAFEE